MRHYEAVIIYDTAVDSQEIQASLDRSLTTISSFEGSPGSIDRWGRRTFAYEVNHKREGYYVIASFTGEPATKSCATRSFVSPITSSQLVRRPTKEDRDAR